MLLASSEAAVATLGSTSRVGLVIISLSILIIFIRVGVFLTDPLNDPIYEHK